MHEIDAMQHERDVIEVCKSLMIAVLVGGGAKWDDARQTVDDVVQDCLDDPGYAVEFVKGIRAELWVHHSGSRH